MIKNIFFKKYIVIGCFNTICTYFISLGAYSILENKIGLIGSGIIANILCIKFSFWMQRLFVFKSKNIWIYEYIKSNIAYGSLAVINIILMYIFVKSLDMTLWISQIILIPVSVLISYAINYKYTFKIK